MAILAGICKAGDRWAGAQPESRRSDGMESRLFESSPFPVIHKHDPRGGRLGISLAGLIDPPSRLGLASSKRHVATYPGRLFSGFFQTKSDVIARCAGRVWHVGEMGNSSR